MHNSSSDQSFKKAGLLAYQLYQQQSNNQSTITDAAIPDYLLTFSELEHRAKNNDPSAQFLVGRAYWTGTNGVVKNRSEGEKWFELARKNRIEGQSPSPGSLCAEGVCFKTACGGIINRDQDKASRCFELANLEGYVPAMVELACMLKDNCIIQTTVVENDRNVLYEHEDKEKMSRAIELLTNATEAKYIPAYMNLAECYIDEKGVQMDKAQALKLHQLAADNGSGYAKMRLGDFYNAGWANLAQDKREAKRLYREARDQGQDIGGRLDSCCTII